VGGTGLKPGTKHKTTVITDAIIEALEANNNDLAKKFVKSLVVNAMKGNGSAIKTLVERAEGLLKESVETSGTVRIIYEGSDSPTAEVPSCPAGDLAEPEAI